MPNDCKISNFLSINDTLCVRHDILICSFKIAKKWKIMDRKNVIVSHRVNDQQKKHKQTKITKLMYILSFVA